MRIRAPRLCSAVLVLSVLKLRLQQLPYLFRSEVIPVVTEVALCIDALGILRESLDVVLGKSRKACVHPVSAAVAFVAYGISVHICHVRVAHKEI